MAKEKQTRRMIAMALAAAVTMSSVPVVAFAEDGEGSESSSTGTVTVTVTASENTTTTTTKTDISTGDASDSYEGHKTETSVTVGSSDAEGGETSTTDTKIDTDFDSELKDGEISKSQTTDETTTTTADGTTTVENVQTENSIDAEGNSVEKEVTVTITTTTDADGNVIETTTEEGSETTVDVEDATAEDLENADLPDVKLDLDSGEETVTETVTVKVSDTKSDILENGVDIGDKAVIEEIERIVKAELSETTTTDNSTVEHSPVVAPEDYEGKEYDPSGLGTQVIWVGEKGYNTTVRDYDALKQGAVIDQNYEDLGLWGEQPEGYDFIISGSAEVTDAAAPAVMEIYYQRDAVTGELLTDADGNYIVDEEKSHYISGGANRDVENGLSNQTSIITVKKEKPDGTFEYFYAYCADRETPAPNVNTGWYKIADIEDADYYSEEAAAKVRAIAENGYWGTEEGTGSLASIKEMLKEKYSEEYNNEEAKFTVTDKNGQEVSFTYKELIDGLEEHEALACTQGAIWNYSNSAMDTEDGVKQIIEGIYSTLKFTNSKGTSEYEEYYREYDMASDARMQVLFECLMNLDPAEKTTDVDDRNTITDMDLVIGDKADSYIVIDEATGESVDVNSDDNKDNDAYKTSVQFTVAIIPGDDDNITVAVLDGEGNMMKDENGDPIVKRLLNQESTVEDANAIRPDANGTYTLDGLVFQENSNVKFDLKLEGLQHLNDKGVVIYQAYDGNGDGNNRNDSQTLVGLVDQVQNVDVTQSMTLKFDVDENKKVTATSTWRKSSSRTVTPDDGGDDEGGTTPPGGGGGNGGGGDNPPVDIIDEDVPLGDAPEFEEPGEEILDIEDGDVPMADAPEDPMVLGEEESIIAETGDSNHMTAGFGGMFAALIGMLTLKKKREN